MCRGFCCCCCCCCWKMLNARNTAGLQASSPPMTSLSTSFFSFLPKRSSNSTFTRTLQSVPLRNSSCRLTICKQPSSPFLGVLKPSLCGGSSNFSFSDSSEKLGSKRRGTSISWLCKDSTMTEAPTEEEEATGRLGGGDGGGEGGGEGDGGGGDNGNVMGWISSATVFAFWVALVLYASLWAPNQTPYRDIYFLEKLSGLKGDDGFTMNPILVSVWLLLGLWGVIYNMLLLPSGRSERRRTLVWPFAVASFFFGAFALLPYFGLWQPPPPRVSKEELKSWPLNVLESKLLSLVLLASGTLIAGNAFFSSSENWQEYFQYFRESKFIHVMTMDFMTLTSLAPFWIYNDMSVRIWLKKGYWLIPLSVIPVLGPALYLFLRPPLPTSYAEKA